MTLIAKILDLEIYSFIESLSSDATAGFKSASYDARFPRGRVMFMEVSITENFLAYKVGIARRLNGSTHAFTALGQEADGFHIVIYQPDAVARTYRLNVLIGVKR